MTSTSLRGPRRGRLLALGAALAFVAALAAGPGAVAPAQTKDKKADPKAKSPQVISDIQIAGDTNLVELINKEIEKKWADNKLVPAERCSDHEFLRRASLD